MIDIIMIWDIVNSCGDWSMMGVLLMIGNDIEIVFFIFFFIDR